MTRGSSLLLRYRKKSSVTDSFSNLVHRPTMDQFTEGVAPRCLLNSAGPGQPSARSREGEGRGEGEEAVILPVSWRGLCLGLMLGHAWGLRSGSLVKAGPIRLLPAGITAEDLEDCVH